MNLHEFQAKQFFRAAGIPVPEGEVVDTPSGAVDAAGRLGGQQWMVKAQIHAGARAEAGGIRRAGKKIKQENAGKEGIDQLDIGFRVLKIDTSEVKSI